MNYRHAFHAGNFADVFKHALLCRVLTYLVAKPTPLRFVDTHAGIGRYDLGGEEAARTGEWRSGVGRLVGADLSREERRLLEPYLEAVGPCDGEGRPETYPGSPSLAQSLLRPQDRLLLCELHPADAALLKANMAGDRRIKVFDADGYAALPGFVPPPERRGVVLIDPPFEERDEFERAAAALTKAHRKWPTGTYMLWYPIKDAAAVRRLAETVVAAGIRRVLQLHLFVEIRQGIDHPLAGTGLIAVNPPFTLKDEAGILLPCLARLLGRASGGDWACRELVGE